MKKIIFTVFCAVAFYQHISCMGKENVRNEQQDMLENRLCSLYVEKDRLLQEAIEAKKDMDSGYLRANFQNFYIGRLSGILKSIDDICHTMFGISLKSDEYYLEHAKNLLNDK